MTLKSAFLNTFAGVIAVVALAASTVSAQEASAKFSPDEIYLDQTSTYTLSISGNASRTLNLPLPDGLNVVSQRRGSNAQIINGRFSQTLEIVLTVQAAEAGTYTIDSFQLGDVTVPAATLKVLPLSEARQQQIEEEAERQREAQEQIIGMNLQLDSETIYVGQAVPMSLVAYVWTQYFAEPLQRPLKEGDAFTIEEFAEEPIRAYAMQGGRRYLQYVWENTLTPLKAGNFTVQFKEPFVVGRSFFNQQQIELSTEPLEVTVLPLPSEGRPVDFAGAIGNFTIEQPEIDATRVQAGEPITMRVVIDGEGNFARMGAPILRNREEWKVYPPDDFFKPSEAGATAGIMVYEYVIIPRSEAVTETPVVAFSFFEPEAAEYVEIVTKPLSVEVLPAPPGSRPILDARDESPMQARGPELLPIMNSMGPVSASIRPIFFNPVFLSAQVIPFCALLGLFFWKRQQLRLENDVDYARTRRARKELARHLQAAADAARAADTTLYFEQAVRAIQTAVAPHLRREPESLTLDEVEAYLLGIDASEEVRLTARASFEAGDALRFGGLTDSSLDLSSELARLKKLVSEVEGGVR